MKGAYISDIDRLAFLSAITARVAEQSELIPKLVSCLTNESVKHDTRIQKSSSNIVYYHSPSRMIEFLSLFSRDDRFKWFTHKWDMRTSFDINERIAGLEIDKSVLGEMAYPKVSGPVVNEGTYKQVWNFINFSNPKPNIYTWKNTKFKNIRWGWHSVVQLSKENLDIPVENLILSDGHQFKDYIKMFKAVIEFRTDLDDDDRFSELIWSGITDWLPKDFDIEFDSKFDEIGEDLNVYCDVIALLSALNTICTWMTKHKARSSMVKVNLISEDDYYILEISHIGSYFNNIEKLRNASGDLEDLRKRLFSVCDFSLEGDYRKDGKVNGSLIVNALDRNTSMVAKSLSPCDVRTSEVEIGGVTYKLKIYIK